MGERPRECLARVTAVRALAPEILEADLRMEEPAGLPFEAGQWVSIPFGPKIVRAYSIGSTPEAPASITLCADVAPGGIGSRWFRSLKPGDAVRFKGPLGGFVFTRADPRPPIFVAEEIGIVPIASILRALYATGFGRPTILAYWGRDPGWLTYDAEFRSLARRYPAFSYHPVVASATGPWKEAPGGLAEVVDRVVHDVVRVVAYVSGGEAMITRVREVLMAKGLDRKSIKWEKFW